MTSKPRFLNPDTLSKPPGYTHVVDMAGPARIIYIAGQLALDRSGKIVGTGDFRAAHGFPDFRSRSELLRSELHPLRRAGDENQRLLVCLPNELGGLTRGEPADEDAPDADSGGDEIALWSWRGNGGRRHRGRRRSLRRRHRRARRSRVGAGSGCRKRKRSCEADDCARRQQSCTNREGSLLHDSSVDTAIPVRYLLA